ncbi:hypothetical protein BJV78DRAFT_1227778 [Lactifluus subvellereus]|nr:hypothetical protein BJV78DRAFT_1227778 [Lactifluus subvellereus]
MPIRAKLVLSLDLLSSVGAAVHDFNHSHSGVPSHLMPSYRSSVPTTGSPKQIRLSLLRNNTMAGRSTVSQPF